MAKLTEYNQIYLEATQAGVGTTDAITNIPNPSTVIVIPTLGSTASAEYTTDPTYTAWEPWAMGSVTAYANDVLVADILALRLRVTSGTATMRIIGGRRG